jgi:von Willebrand factor type A C-terminal domain/von Willebrand factor type A domain
VRERSIFEWELSMADFTAAVYQNEFLPDGGTDVNAIVTITCSGAGTAGQTGAGDAGEIVIVDTSGSMGRTKLEAAKQAASVAIEQIVDGTYFAVVAGTHQAYLAFPPVRQGAGMVRMEPGARFAAHQAISAFRSDGGTAMGTWLTLAGRLFDSIPLLAQKHAILLTDGENHNETPEQLTSAIAMATGRFQCDCFGVGVDWQVAEVRRIAQALLGEVEFLRTPDQMSEIFARTMQQAMSRGVADAQLRVWAPQGAQVLFVKQVSPDVMDLTPRRAEVNPLTGGYPTGSWGDESRDYHISVRLPAKAVGQEQLAARVQLAVADQVVAQGLVKAKWSDDEVLTTRINPQVAHYTNQTELADAIQEGLAAKAAGDDETATQKLGRAVQLAKETGNAEATTRLRKVVEIDNEETGTVRLKRAVDKADEMALDTASTKTTRVRG